MSQGRPTKYKAEYAKQATKLCALGATDVELADFFEVHISTIYHWRNTRKGFSDALKAGKEGYDDRVERSLALSAIGYSHPETKVHVCEGVPVETEVMKHYPPNPASAKLWLSCRRPDKWREQTVEDDDTPAPTKVEIVVQDARIRDNDSTD